MPQSPMKLSPRAVNIALLLALSSIWGSSYMLIKIGLDTVPPVTVAAARIALGAATLLVVVQIRGLRLPRGVRAWTPFAVMAMVGNVLPFSLIAWGETHIHSGLTAILLGVVPVSTMVLAHIFTTDERFTANKLAGLAAGFAGLIVLVGPDALAGLGGSLAGKLAVVGAALCYATSIVYARRLRHVPVVVSGAASLAIATVIIVPVSLIAESPWQAAPSAASVAALVLLGVVGTALATLIFFRLVACTGATFTSLINYLIPLFGVLWGAAVLAERLPATALAGLALILSGIALVNRRPTPENPPETSN
jgi:drug/metabolite transporter (DMT)-like permease